MTISVILEKIISKNYTFFKHYVLFGKNLRFNKNKKPRAATFYRNVYINDN